MTLVLPPLSDAIPVLQRADNGTYYIHWREKGRSKKLSTRSQNPYGARVALAAWLADIDSGIQRVSRPKAKTQQEELIAPTCATCWEVYREHHLSARADSLATAGYCWANLSRSFGGMQPKAITQREIEAYEAQRMAGRIGRKSRSSTVRRELVTLLAALRFCTTGRHRLITADDVPAIRLPLKGPPRDRWLREKEIERLIKAGRSESSGRLSRIERFLVIAYATGARQGAILELTWDRIDFEARSIDFRDPTRRETRKRRAIVPMSDELFPFMVLAFDQRTGPHVLDHTGEIKTSIRRAADKAKLPGVTANVLRHTTASHLARDGVPLWLVGRLLGNSQAMIDKVYAKWAPDDLKDAVNRLKLPGPVARPKISRKEDLQALRRPAGRPRSAPGR